METTNMSANCAKLIQDLNSENGDALPFEIPAVGQFTQIRDVIEVETLQELFPAEMENLIAACNKHGLGMDDFGLCFHFGGPALDDLTEFLMEDNPKDDAENVDYLALAKAALTDILPAWDLLQKAFQNATRVGDSYLSLEVGYRDREEEGCRYGIDGLYFGVAGSYQITPAGQQFWDQLSRC